MLGPDFLQTGLHENAWEFKMSPFSKSLNELLDAPPNMAAWCLLLLDHLEEFTTLAWFLVADRKLVEETFSRTIIQLSEVPLDATGPVPPYDHARKLLIGGAIAVLELTRRDHQENRSFQANLLGEPPDIHRLEFLLSMAIGSSAKGGADSLADSPGKARDLVCRAIDHPGGQTPLFCGAIVGSDKCLDSN